MIVFGVGVEEFGEVDRLMGWIVVWLYGIVVKCFDIYMVNLWF